MTTEELKQQQIEQAKQEDVQAILDCLASTEPPLFLKPALPKVRPIQFPLPPTLENALMVLRYGMAVKPEAWTVTEAELAGYWEGVGEPVVMVVG